MYISLDVEKVDSLFIREQCHTSYGNVIGKRLLMIVIRDYMKYAIATVL